MKNKEKENKNMEVENQDEMINTAIGTEIQEEIQETDAVEEGAMIDVFEKQNAELKDKYLRLVAEYDNYRRRTAKEKLEMADITKTKLILDFLPIVDDMDRAIVHITNNIKPEEFEKNIEGIQLIADKFHKFLTNNGISEIEVKGKDFDVDLHEAVTKIPVTDETQKGKIIDVIQTGYKMNDKIVRYAKVVVGE
jgi:molecular chaperone GrpE